LVLNSQRIRQLTKALGKRNRLKEKGMIERVLHPHNMQRAFKQVIANKGSAGVDRMSVTELKSLDGWLRNRLRYCIWHHWRAEREENVQWTFLANEPACG
jgi:hypothetical protein